MWSMHLLAPIILEIVREVADLPALAELGHEDQEFGPGDVDVHRLGRLTHRHRRRFVADLAIDSNLENHVAQRSGAVIEPDQSLESLQARLELVDLGHLELRREHQAGVEQRDHLEQITADAVENSRVVEVNGELQITTTRANKLAMREEDLRKAVEQCASRPMRIKVTVGDPGETQAPMAEKKSRTEDDATRRALSNPEVQRFQELFDDKIYKVRNLKE